MTGTAWGAPGRRLRVHTRAQWMAKEPRRPAVLLDEAPNLIVVHHTATSNTKDFSLARGYALSRAIQRFHMQDCGWDDIGEQLTISRGGHVMEGRNRSLPAIGTGRHVIGAQALGHNDHTIGIENEGTYSTAEVPPPLWRALIGTCAWLCTAYGLNPREAIIGHRDIGSTDCPGARLYQRLPQLRSAVAGRLAGGRPSR